MAVDPGAGIGCLHLHVAASWRTKNGSCELATYSKDVPIVMSRLVTDTGRVIQYCSFQSGSYCIPAQQRYCRTVHANLCRLLI